MLLRLAPIVSLFLETLKNTVAPVMSHEKAEELKKCLTHYEDVVRHLERTHLSQTNKLNDDLSSTLRQERDFNLFSCQNSITKPKIVITAVYSKIIAN